MAAVQLLMRKWPERITRVASRVQDSYERSGRTPSARQWTAAPIPPINSQPRLLRKSWAVQVIRTKGHRILALRELLLVGRSQNSTPHRPRRWLSAAQADPSDKTVH